MKLVVMLVACCVALGAMACTGSNDDSSVGLETNTPAGPPAVPWVDSTEGPTLSPSPYPTANPADLDVRACQGGDLTAEITHANGAAGNNIAYWTFTNASTTACYLEGVPDIRLLDSAGNVLPAVIAKVPCFMQSDVECAATIVAVLPPGGTAGLTTTTPNAPPVCPTTSASLAFGLPEGGGDVSVSYVGGDSCMHMGVGRFEPIVVVTPTPIPQPDLSAALELPASVTAGDTLRFTVELTNNGSEPFSFGALCPNYAVIVGQKDAGGSHSLNCGPVPQIAAGATVAFANRGPRPPDDARRLVFRGLDADGHNVPPPRRDGVTDRQDTVHGHGDRRERRCVSLALNLRGGCARLVLYSHREACSCAWW